MLLKKKSDCMLKQEKKSVVWHCVAVGVVLLVALGVRVYCFQDKSAFFIDEYMSINLSNYNRDGQDYMIENTDIEYTGQKLLEMLYGADNSIDGVARTVLQLRENTRDSAHPSLYYSLLKFSFLGINSTDLEEVAFRGFVLNLLLFLIGFFCLYKLGVLLFGRGYAVGILAVAFFCEISIGNTLFLRPYLLQETLLILVSYVFAEFCVDLQKDKNVFTATRLLVMSFVSALFFSSGFFGLIYWALLSIGVFLLVKKEKRKRVFLFLSSLSLVSIILTSLFYPPYFFSLLDYRGREVLSKYSSNPIANISSCLDAVIDKLQSSYLILLALLSIVCLGGAFVYKRGYALVSTNRVALLLVFSSLFWAGLVFYSAPFKVVRYVAPVVPILLLIIPIFCSVLSMMKRRIVFGFVAAVFLLSSLTTKDLLWGAVAPSDDFLVDTDTPLVVGGALGSINWRKVALSPLFTKNRMIYFTFVGVDEIEKMPYGRFYLIHDGDLSLGVELLDYDVKEPFYEYSYGGFELHGVLLEK